MKYLLALSLLLVACASKPLTADDVAKHLGVSGQAFTAETDPNKLLGRPGQYIEKISFDDGTIEVFSNDTDALKRKEYVESISKATPMLGSYCYVHRNALLRINYNVPPEKAEAYGVKLVSLSPR